MYFLDILDMYILNHKSVQFLISKYFCYLGNTTVGQNIATVVGDAPGLTPAALVDVWFMGLINLNSNIIFNYQRLFFI